MIPQTLRSLLLACLTVAVLAAPAWAQGTLKIAYIDPLSGGAASAGILGQKHFNYFVDKINAAGGVNGQKLEVVAFDNKVNPQETLIILKKVFDEGIRYVAQGNGSLVAHAITDAVPQVPRLRCRERPAAVGVSDQFGDRRPAVHVQRRRPAVRRGPIGLGHRLAGDAGAPERVDAGKISGCARGRIGVGVCGAFSWPALGPYRSGSIAISPPGAGSCPAFSSIATVT